MGKLSSAFVVAVTWGCSGSGGGDGLECGPGTEERDGVCQSVLTCADGTHQEDEGCVADRSCGDGTREVDGACVATLRCGEGTRESDDECLGTLQCGDGTIEEDGACRSLVECGDGTEAHGDECVGIVTCGAGTRLEGTRCLGELQCGEGTRREGDACVAEGVGLPCGAGTVEEDAQCVVADGDARYEVRIAATEVPADGYSRIPVLALGTDALGSPADDDVVLALTDAAAGSLDPATGGLRALGLGGHFVPCSSAADPDCLGPVQITMALAADPGTEVARSVVFELIEPTGVGSAAPCLVGGNVVFFDGDAGDYIHPGVATVTEGEWDVESSPAGDEPSYVHVSLTPAEASEGLWWDVELGTWELDEPMHEQVYEGAERYAFASPGHPGLDVHGDGRGCNEIEGRFQIHELTLDGGAVESFTATFEQHCEGGDDALRGCVHYEP